MANSRFTFPASFPPFPLMLQPFLVLTLRGEWPPRLICPGGTLLSREATSPSYAACLHSRALWAHTWVWNRSCRRTQPRPFIATLLMATLSPHRTDTTEHLQHTLHDPRSLKPSPLQKSLPAPELISLVFPDCSPKLLPIPPSLTPPLLLVLIILRHLCMI